jgi:cytochrome c oxidase assembly protein Cox11
LKALDKTIRVTFDANVNHGLSWVFKPVQHEQVIRIGEQTLAFYKATNTGSKPVTGTATFNVSPAKAGLYFSKIECFCFTEQTLAAGRVDRHAGQLLRRSGYRERSRHEVGEHDHAVLHIFPGRDR